MTIYTPSGDILYEAPITDKAKAVRQLGGDHYIELSFEVGDVLPIAKGCYVEYDGCRYEVMTEVYPENIKGKDAYKYTIKFYAPQHKLQSRCVFWLQSTPKEATFNLTTTIGQYAQLIADNMNTSYGVSRWRVGIIPEDLAERTEFYKFDGVSCWDGLFDIAKLFNVECWIDSNANEDVINFGKLGLGTYIDICEGDIVTSIPVTKGVDSDYGTRFYIYGGTRNLPSYYGEASVGGATNHISEKRLHLPDGKEYIDAWEGLNTADIVEKVVILDDVFPKNTDTVTSVEVVDREIIDGETNKAYVMVCEDTPFRPSMIAVGATLGATFTSGSLEGRSFELSVKKRAFDKRFEIIAQTEDAGGDTPLIIPNEYLHPNAGDTFIITGVELPIARVREAENELLINGKSIAAERSSNREVFKCPTNPVYCEQNDIIFTFGQRVTLIGAQFGPKGRKSRIQGYEMSLYNPYSAVYEIGNNQSYSKFSVMAKEYNDKLSSAKKDTDEVTSHFDTALNKVNHSAANLENKRDFYKQEHTYVESERVIIDEEYNEFIVEYQILRDALGREMRDKNGYIMRVRKATSVYDTYKQAYRSYTAALDNVISSKGLANITPEYKKAENDYYVARAELSKAIAISTKKKIADLDYLKDAFGADNVMDSNGVVLSQLVSVKDVDGDVVAGIYGGANETLNEGGFKDGTHGALMQFAGADNAQSVANAKYRVYEDGTLFANSGVFGGLIKRSPKIITPSNYTSYSNISEMFVCGATKNKACIIDVVSAGSMLVFDGMRDDFAWSNIINAIEFDVYDPNQSTNVFPLPSGKATLEDMLQLVGSQIILYFKRGNFEGISLEDKMLSNGGLQGNSCWWVSAGDVLIATCIMQKLQEGNGKKAILWKYEQY